MDWASYAASLQVEDNDVVAIGNGGNGGNGGASGNGGNGGNGGTFHGDVTVDLNGPVTLGFSGLSFGPVTVGATITLGHFQAGHFVLDNIGASLEARAGTTVVTASGQGTLAPAANGNTTLHVTGSLGFSFDSSPGALAALSATTLSA